MSFSSAVHDLFNRWNQGDLLSKLEALNQRMLDRRKNAVEIAGQHEPGKHTASNCLVLQQVLLHRVERLLAGAGTMLLENNIYGLALAVRGQCESTAVLGYACNRLDSLNRKNVKFELFARNIASIVLGATHPQFKKAPKPPNILTCIEQADKYLDTHLFQKKTGVLSDIYAWLSDFAHPNFLSNSSAFVVDKPNRQFVFRHESDLQESDFQLLTYLELSSDLFLHLFDAFSRQLGASGLDD